MLARNLQKYKKLACFIADLTPKLHVWALVLSCQHTNINTYARMYACVRMCNLQLFWLQKNRKNRNLCIL